LGRIALVLAWVNDHAVDEAAGGFEGGRVLAGQGFGEGG
jgi:hypothetical protein